MKLHQRGGKKIGAGRPFLPQEDKRKMVSIRLSQAAIESLEKVAAKTGLSKTEVIEKLLLNAEEVM